MSYLKHLEMCLVPNKYHYSYVNISKTLLNSDANNSGILKGRLRKEITS